MPPVVWPYLLGRFADRHHRTVLDTHNLALRPKQYPPLVIGPLGPKVEQLACSSDSRGVELVLSVRHRTRSLGAEGDLQSIPDARAIVPDTGWPPCPGASHAYQVEDAGVIDFKGLELHIEVGDKCAELLLVHGPCGEAVLAHDDPVASEDPIDISDETGSGLTLEPVQAILPEPIRVGGEQRHTAGSQHADNFPNQHPPVDVKSRDPVLDADDPVERPRREPELLRVGAQEAAVCRRTKSLSGQPKAGK